MSVDLQIDDVGYIPHTLVQAAEIRLAGLDAILGFVGESRHRRQLGRSSSASPTTSTACNPTSPKRSLRSSASSGALSGGCSRSGCSGSGVAIL
jgi:hypothetical protein